MHEEAEARMRFVGNAARVAAICALGALGIAPAVLRGVEEQLLGGQVRVHQALDQGQGPGPLSGPPSPGAQGLGQRLGADGLEQKAPGASAHRLVERRVLAYDEPLATWWPAFAEHGKGTITLRHALSHRAGLPASKDIAPMAHWT